MLVLTTLAFLEESYKIYLLSRYALYPLIPKFYENACYYELYPCLNAIIDCLDTFLIISNKMHAEWYTIQINFDCLMIVSKKQFRYIP